MIVGGTQGRRQRKCEASFRKDRQFHLFLPISKMAKLKLASGYPAGPFHGPTEEGSSPAALAIKPRDKIKCGQVGKSPPLEH